MARGVNKVILIGRLGSDPEMKYTASGTPLCKFRMATNEVFKDRDGNQQERTEWHRITAWWQAGRDLRPIPQQGPGSVRGRLA